jgi:hypothetical protein
MHIADPREWGGSTTLSKANKYFYNYENEAGRAAILSF